MTCMTASLISTLDIFVNMLKLATSLITAYTVASYKVVSFSKEVVQQVVQRQRSTKASSELYRNTSTVTPTVTVFKTTRHIGNR